MNANRDANLLRDTWMSAGRRRGRADVRSTASSIEAPDFSAYSRLGHRCEGLNDLIAAAKANDDWEKYLGARGMD